MAGGRIEEVGMSDQDMETGFAQKQPHLQRRRAGVVYRGGWQGARLILTNVEKSMSSIDQARAWNAYGQAMAAAAALDLLFKVSNFHDRALKIVGDSRNLQAKQDKLVKNVMRPHFSQSAYEFYESHTELHSDLFKTALGNAIDFRNYLSHQYFGVIWRLLSSEEGLDIIACECAHYRDHFVQLEHHIRAHGNCDFLQFFFANRRPYELC